MKKIRYWIMKSEPSEFSIDDLRQQREAIWDGIRNYQVRNMIRDAMQVGDKALFYHSSCALVGVVGTMEIIGKAVPDPTQFDAKSKYYDPLSTQDAPRWLAPHVRYVSTLPHMVSLAMLRDDKALTGLTILRAGNRLSVTEVSSAEFNRIVKMGTATI
jgi:predicted RNA-binding protein with PUA-like domain